MSDGCCCGSPAGAHTTVVDLNWLRAFLAVVDHGGFAAASVHLYRSQGRISSYIAALERDLGVQLFDRHQRPVRLTAAGEVFVEHARSVVGGLETGRAAIAAVETRLRGDVALATYPSAGATYVPEVLRRFSQDFPGIRPELFEYGAHGIDLALDEGSALVAIRPTLPPPPQTLALDSELLWREPMCVVVRDGHALAGQDVADLTALDGERFVITGRSLHYDTEAFRLLANVDVKPKVAFVSDQPQTLVGLVRNELAVGFTNRLALENTRTDGVSVIDVSPPLHRDVSVYWTSAVEAYPAAKALLETVRRTPAPPTTTDLRGPSFH